jgi:hypothetical protein
MHSASGGKAKQLCVQSIQVGDEWSTSSMHDVGCSILVRHQKEVESDCSGAGGRLRAGAVA